MAWATPKTDWGVDLVGSADLNRIEENTRVLHQGNGHTPIAVTVTTENLILPTTDGNFFTLSSTGNVTVNRIDGTDWTIGSIVYLYLNDSVQIYYNADGTVSGTYLPIARFANPLGAGDTGNFGGGYPGCVAILMKHINYWILLNSYFG
jgi:hypothetical protein